MAYEEEWDEDLPTGNMAARTADDYLRSKQTATRERLCDIFGEMTLEQWQADPISPLGLRINGQNDVDIIGGDETTRITNDDDEDDLIINHNDRCVDVSVIRGLLTAPSVTVQSGNISVIPTAQGTPIAGRCVLTCHASPTASVVRVSFNHTFPSAPFITASGYITDNGSSYVAITPVIKDGDVTQTYFDITLAVGVQNASEVIHITWTAIA